MMGQPQELVPNTTSWKTSVWARVNTSLDKEISELFYTYGLVKSFDPAREVGMMNIKLTEPVRRPFSKMVIDILTKYWVPVFAKIAEELERIDGLTADGVNAVILPVAWKDSPRVMTYAHDFMKLI